ncbi:MAG: FAD binding domain-containing protein, partial [bacterium]
SAVLRDQCPVVSDTAATIGDPQVRNRGTLGGSLAHADPAADYPAMLLAVDAQIQLQGPGGTRAVAAQDFFQDLFTVDLRADEIITAVRFAPVRAAAYAKLYQRASRFAIVGVAAALAVADGVISSARIGLTGALSSAVRLPHVEEALVGQAPTAETAANAAKGAGTSLSDVNGDLHASEGYRRAMVSVFTKRAIEGALARV